MRAESAQKLVEIGFDGYAVGGLAVGEGQARMLAVLDGLKGALPAARPRYLMGVGTPDDIVEGVRRGIDLFDCVLPTRSGRTARAYTSAGTLNMRNARHAEDPSPVDPVCACPTCAGYGRAYLHHLFRAGEMLGPILLSQHNLFFYQRLMAGLRAAIAAGRLDAFAVVRGADRAEPRVVTRNHRARLARISHRTMVRCRAPAARARIAPLQREIKRASAGWMSGRLPCGRLPFRSPNAAISHYIPLYPAISRHIPHEINFERRASRTTQTTTVVRNAGQGSGHGDGVDLDLPLGPHQARHDDGRRCGLVVGTQVLSARGAEQGHIGGVEHVGDGPHEPLAALISASASTASMLSQTRSICASTSSGTLPSGSTPICPDMCSRRDTFTASTPWS